MTSQKDQIQALITDIDGVLQKTTPRLPWVVSGEMTQQRQVLERVRNYLVAFQRRQVAGEGFGQAGARPDLLAHDIYYQPASPPYSSSEPESQREQRTQGQNEVNAQQMLQAIVQEMGSLRSNLMQPLQADLEVLRQQRETLVYEIRQLEAQRQGYVGQLPGQQQLIGEFLQALMSRLQETLPQQLAQTLSNQQALPYSDAHAANLALSGSAPSALATSNALSKELSPTQASQVSSDEMLIRLDSTLSVVFESLQRNVQSYQESLAQGLEKMHSMGQQGEMMFTALIGHLAEQLGRETSSYLQPSAPTNHESVQLSPQVTAPTGTPLPLQSPVPSASSLLFSQPDAEALSPFVSLPFPGTEISDYAATSPASTTEPSVDTAIDSWLRSASSASTSPDVDLEIAALNLDGFDLSQLAAQDVNALLELDATLLGTDLPPQPLLSPIPPLASPSVEDTADIDAALKLLEQLSSELQEQPTSVADADAQIDRMLSSPTALAGDTSSVGIPDDARDELDEFYESLFGTDASETDAAPPQDVLPPDAIDTSDTAPQLIASPVIEPATVAPPGIQPITTQPSDIQSVVQPISTLPAETLMPTGALAEPNTPAAPATSTATDLTLGWHLPSSPSVAQPAAELEIPEALLEDELLDGWDFAETEVEVSEPVATLTVTPSVTDLLNGWEQAPSDRALLPPEALLSPATDPLAAVFNEAQPPVTDASSEPASLFDVAPVTDQRESSQSATSQDEISSLTDLLGETAFGEVMPTEAQPPELAIAEVPAPMPNQPPVDRPARDSRWAFPATTQTTPADLTEGYLVDDRYTPASPEESLLSLDEPIEALDSELWLDENTLSRLSEDLFNLEEAIDESATQFRNREPDADSQALFGDFADTLAPSETLPGDSEATTLADWSDVSLDDFAFNEFAPDVAPDVAAPLPTATPALFPLESESHAIAADPPGTFLLEGMDDLFANTPVTPPVTAIEPPVAPTATELPDVLTLEGMDDLFTDSVAVDRSVVTVSNPTAPFTLEGVGDLFADAPVANPEIPPTVSTPTAPFTLEDVSDLFADTPVANPETPPTVSNPTAPFTLEDVSDLFADAPVANPETPPTVSTPTAPFTLEDVSDLFADTPVVNPAFPSTTAPAAPPFTLEGMGDLFTDELVANPASPPPPNAPTADQPLPFTLEGVGELFADIPPITATPPESDRSSAVVPVRDGLPSEAKERFSAALTQPETGIAFTLETGNFSGALPASEVPADPSAIGSTPTSLPADSDLAAPFTFEQMGDLFIEMPSGGSTLDVPPLSEPSPAPFTFEQMGDLFIETPSAAIAAVEQPTTPQLTTQPDASEPSALEQAFASLMGSFDEPLDASSLDGTAEDGAQAPEKKKEMS